MQDDAGAVVQSAPLVLGTDRTSIPLLVYRGPSGRSVGGTTVLIRARHNQTVLRQANTTGDWDVLRYNVTSPRYRQWHDSLTDRSGVDSCELHPGEERVSCTLDAPPTRLYVTTVEIQLRLEK
ncbi:hypothetical protein VB773_13030 [Haloarculaceae archaeon H-GB2-1]|nr:hypothetical protein [Haloarculaceae archaeon H-GB2-1]